MMKGLIAPVIAASQVLAPEGAGIQAFQTTKGLGADNGTAIMAMTNAIIGGYMSWFAKE